jgi:hypothetical protein
MLKVSLAVFFNAKGLDAVHFDKKAIAGHLHVLN